MLIGSPPVRNSSLMRCKIVDNSDKEILLEQLQAQADGPLHTCEIRERSLGQAAGAALIAVLLVILGGWLISLPASWHLRSAQLWFWVPGTIVLVAGLAALLCSEAFRRRHGKRVLLLTPDSVQFNNAIGPTPWHHFEGFELEQSHFSLAIVFWVSVGNHAPALNPVSFKSLAAPDAWSVANGMRIKLWLFNPMLEGQRLDFERLTDLLYAYLNAAQARATLDKLFPTVKRISMLGQNTDQ